MADAVAERIDKGILDQALISANGIDIYQQDITNLVNEYINRLPDPQSIKEPNVFIGLLDYIYITKLAFIFGNTRTRKGKKLDYESLDSVFWSIYIPLCVEYNITPTIIMFCSMLRITEETINDIKLGSYRNGYPATPEATSIVQKWYIRCENALYSRAVEKNSIGSIFALKAKHGYNDNSQNQTIINVTQVDHMPDQIAEVLKIAETAN